MAHAALLVVRPMLASLNILLSRACCQVPTPQIPKTLFKTQAHKNH